MRVYRWPFFVLIFFFIFLVGCQKENSSPQWDMQISMPIVRTTLTLHHLVPDSLMQVDSSGMVTLVYRVKMSPFSIDSILQIPDTLVNFLNKIKAVIPAPPGWMLYNNSFSKPIKIGDTKLKSLSLKQGFITLYATSTIQEEALLVYDLPSATRQGEVLSTHQIIPASNGVSEVFFQKKFPIDGYTFDLSGPAKDTVNFLTSDVDYMINPEATQTIYLTPNDSFHVYTILSELEVADAVGYFGKKTIQVMNQSIPITIFNQVQADLLAFNSVKAKLTISNGIGVDGELYLTQIVAKNSKTNASVVLTGDIMNKAIAIPRAQKGIDPKDISHSTTTISFSQTNIKELIELMPNELVYSMVLVTNPNGNTSLNTDFYRAGHLFDAEFTMEIPLEVNAKNLLLKDSIPYDIFVENSAVNSGNFQLVVTNHFPFDADIQVYLYNEQHLHPIDSLFGVGATILGNAKTILPITLSKERRINLLERTHAVMPSIRLRTLGDVPVPLQEGFTMDIQLNGDINYIRK